ncbi:MAG: redoxin domain-containing protein, partial [bacterium]
MRKHNMLIIIAVFLFLSAPRVEALTRKNGAKGKSFPEIEFSYQGKLKALSSYRGSPVFILAVDPSSGSFKRVRKDFEKAISFLEKKGVKYMLLFLKDPGEKIREPFAVDREHKVSDLLRIPRNRPFSFFVLNPKGVVVLSSSDVHGPILDISKIMQVYYMREAYRKGAFTISYGERLLAPDINALDIKGNRFKLFDQRGKAVLLIFFSIDCPYCRKEMPMLVELSKKEGLVTVGICSSGNKKEIDTFVK